MTVRAVGRRDPGDFLRHPTRRRRDANRRLGNKLREVEHDEAGGGVDSAYTVSSVATAGANALSVRMVTTACSSLSSSGWVHRSSMTEN